MAEIVKIKSNKDDRGALNVLEAGRDIPFEVKRVFYIHGVSDPSIVRGKHRHKETYQALICLSGSCIVFSDNGKEQEEYKLDSPDDCLILNPEDWHTMYSFTEDTVLLVLASAYYDPDDYIHESY